MILVFCCLRRDAGSCTSATTAATRFCFLLFYCGASRKTCELLGGSFFDAIAAAGEIWALSQVLHDWPDAECRTILGRCREAMRETDRLLVIEMLTVPCQPNVPINMIDMTMLMYFGEARQRTVDEYKKLLDATGFALMRVLPTRGAFSIVEAQPI